ncbi:MAG: transketolase [Candidatus Magasanikbacteria bacterium]
MENDLHQRSKIIRKNILEILSRSKSSHIGSCFSIVDLLVVLYSRILNIKATAPQDPNRDIFMLSKGHAAVALYAVLAEFGFVSSKILDTFGKDGTVLANHVTINCLSGVENTAGSLGHVLSMAAGMAWAAKAGDNNNRRFYCLMGDGECNEGSVWEAAMFAKHHQLNNLVAIVDYNKQQGMGFSGTIMNFENMAERWQAFGWEVVEVSGHNFEEIERSFAILNSSKNKNPKLLLANTIKGKGVSFMENKVEWHYKSPNQLELDMAIRELDSI